MKKGFTLIELLSVIIILAIILVVAVPKIMDKIEDVRLQSYISNEKILVKAASTYVVLNPNLAPQNIGGTTEIKVSDLKSSSLISEIIDPSDKNIECNGYVLVTKIEEGVYDYTPHMKCGAQNTIADLAADRLIAHYKFDDFQEPTQNYLSESVYQSWFSSLTIGSSSDRSAGGGIIRITRVGENRYRATVIQDATYPILSITNSFVWSANVSNTFSAYITDYYEAPGTTGRIGLGRSSNGTSNLHGVGGIGYKSYSQSDATDINAGMAIRAANVLITVGSYIEWEFLQLEMNKQYSTPYTQNSRVGIVNDYSGNGNSTQLLLTTTPKWVSNNSDGEYELNGVNSYIGLPASLSTALNNSNFTLSAWIKSPSMASGMTLGGIISLNYGLSMSISPEGNLCGRIDNGTSLPIWCTSGINLLDNKYHFTVMTYDGTNMRLYVDGIKKYEVATVWNNRYSNTGAIGYEANNPPTCRYLGTIDDVVIYKRALTEKEIKQNYDVENIR